MYCFPLSFPEETRSQSSNRQRFKKSRIWIRYNLVWDITVLDWRELFLSPLSPPPTHHTNKPQQSNHSFHFISLTTSHVFRRQPWANLITRLHSRHCHTTTSSCSYYFFHKFCSLGSAAELYVVPRLNPFSWNLYSTLSPVWLTALRPSSLSVKGWQVVTNPSPMWAVLTIVFAIFVLAFRSPKPRLELRGPLAALLRRALTIQCSANSTWKSWDLWGFHHASFSQP